MNKFKLLIIGFAVSVMLVAFAPVPGDAAVCAVADGQRNLKGCPKAGLQDAPGEAEGEKALKCGMKCGMKKGKGCSAGKLYTECLPMVSSSVDEAVKAVEAGNKDLALTELKKIKDMLSRIENCMKMQMKPKYMNSKCPVMGAPIDPNKVTDELVREIDGKKVAFCCGGCPAIWDKLSEEEKQAKLKGVKSEHPGCAHEDEDK